jgi:hypothetical protein
MIGHAPANQLGAWKPYWFIRPKAGRHARRTRRSAMVCSIPRPSPRTAGRPSPSASPAGPAARSSSAMPTTPAFQRAAPWAAGTRCLVGDGDGRPMIATFSSCVDSIRIIPFLQHDPDRPEDVMTDSEDHAEDEWRHACMSRSWVPAVEAPETEECQRLSGGARRRAAGGLADVLSGDCIGSTGKSDPF